MKEIFMAKEEQPAYKVANMGFSSVTNVELLSLVIGGAPDKALNIARQVMAKCDGSLANLARLQKNMFAECEGLGTAKINAIMAAVEIGRRRQSEEYAGNNQVFSSSQKLADLFRPRLQDFNHEVAEIALLNHALKLIKVVRISEGGLTETAVDVRLVIREAILNNATVVALAHNHPSGNSRPSTFDDQLTKQVREGCKTMRLHLCDHIIIAGNDFYSYNDEGKL